MVFKVLGQLLLVETSFMSLPLAVCLFNGEHDWLAFAATIAVTLAVGATTTFGIKPRSALLHRHDGLLLASLAWVMFSLFGMLPFMLCDTPLTASEAFFEAMSGFTTTGATVIRDVEVCSHGILVWRALTQWIGGLGIILFTLTFIPSLNNSGSLMMFHAEATGITHDKLGARIARTAKLLWALYTLLTILLITLLWLGPMTLFDSICHGFSAISTGGFSTRNQSIADFDSAYIKGVLTLFMLVGGVSFTLIITSVRNSWRSLWRDEVFRTYLTIIAVFYILMVVAVLRGGHATGWQSVTIDPIFHIVSALTSTGYSAGNWEGWGVMVLTLTMFMMYVGACAGSTTGGAKIDRLVFLLKNMRLVVRRYVRPRLLQSVSVAGNYISHEMAGEIIAFIFVYTLLIAIGGVMLVAQGFPIVDAFFSSLSCVSNNGLGAGVTGITGSFDFLPESGKWMMSMLMLAGRLEIITLLAVFTRSFWRE